MAVMCDYTLHIFRSSRFQGIIEEAIEFFEQTPVHALLSISRFVGSGVYALYYVGDSDLYTRLSEVNLWDCVYPIYVGKAVPPGWRTGRVRTSTTPDVYRRLKEHKNSIIRVMNLHIDDFRCRFIILNDLESDLIVPFEAELIRRYKPLWNMTVDGFGNHDPGSGRYNQAKSEWDVLHPGRPWAERLTGEAPDVEEVIENVYQHLENLRFS